MPGGVDAQGIGPADALLREYGEEIGVGDTFANTRVGVFFDQPGREVPDPFFGGEGPARAGCRRCGSCMVGCRYNAKNTLVKNYLWFAEKLGVEIVPDRLATEVRPLGAADGSDGYAVTSVHPGAWLRRRRQTLTARGVVFAAGPLGTNQLLANCRHSGALPRLADRIGRVVRTNSESVQAVTAPGGNPGLTEAGAITPRLSPRPPTPLPE